MPSETDYLLDTHVWVWMLEGDLRRIGPRTRASLSEAAFGGRLRVSPNSAWEIGVLVRKERIGFSVPCAQWVQRAVNAPGISLAPLTPAVAVDSSILPGEFHGDPADRMLIATARTNQATLLTMDAAILDYSRRGHVRAADCRR